MTQLYILWGRNLPSDFTAARSILPSFDRALIHPTGCVIFRGGNTAVEFHHTVDINETWIDPLHVLSQIRPIMVWQNAIFDFWSWGWRSYVFVSLSSNEGETFAREGHIYVPCGQTLGIDEWLYQHRGFSSQGERVVCISSIGIRTLDENEA